MTNSFFHGSPPFYEGLSPEQREAIEKAVFAGNKIEAVKLLRAAKGGDLASAKAQIEAWTAHLAEQSPERFRKAPRHAGAGSGGCVGVLVAGLLLTVFFLVRPLLASEPAEDSYFPLKKGMYWVYKGKVEWTENRKEEETGPAKVHSKVLTQRVEVLDTVQQGACFAARLSGFPTELAWYDPSRPAREYVIVRLGSSYYCYLVDEDALKFWEALREGASMPLREILERRNVLLDGPLVDGKIFGDMMQAPEERYCYMVEAMKVGLPEKIGGKERERDGFSITYRSAPDHFIWNFVPGLGFTHYEYRHHGTVASADLNLVEAGMVTTPRP